MRRTYKALFIAVIGLTMVSCVSVNQIPMTPETASGMRNKNVATVKHDRPDFAAMTAGKAMFAMLGAVAMISAGNEIIAKNNVEDPAIYIGEKLRAELSVKYGTKLSSKPVTITTDDVHAISKSNPGTDLILDIRTVNWSFAYFPTTWDKYRVIYSSRLRLIDVKDAIVLAEGFCSRIPDQTPSSPTYDELLANNAERLKRELREAADYCVGDFETKVLRF